MSRPITKNQLSDLWSAEFVSHNHHCCLCGNYGIIDTRGKIRTPAGVECGKRVFCVCPNVRALKAGGANLDQK